MSQPVVYPTLQPEAAPRSQRVRPSGWWIVAGVVVMVAGIVGAVSVGIVGFMHMGDTVKGFHRVSASMAPREAYTGMPLEASHDYTIYYEYPGATTTTTPENFTAQITDPTGRPVELEPYRSQVTYQFGGHEGRAAYSFRTSEGGTYRVFYVGRPKVTFAIGDGLGSSIQTTVLPALALGVTGFVLGSAVILTAVIRRRRAGR